MTPEEIKKAVLGLGDVSTRFREMVEVTGRTQQHQVERLRSVQSTNELADIAQANLADGFHERLMKYIAAFEDKLDDDHEVGMRLVSFGQSITFHVTEMSYANPSLIAFDGVLESGSPVQLVQHVSQISFLLMAVKRLDPTQPKRRIGFASCAEEPQE